MSSVRGKVCAVTGAGSGIGRALALELARRGARLALSDVDAETVAGTAAAAEAAGAQVHHQTLDEADRPRILVGNDAKLVDKIVRLLPVRYAKLSVAAERRFER